MNTRNLGIGFLIVMLFELPISAFFLSGHSEFLNFWEFACYRYYTGLGIINGDLQSIWVVQGFPMAIFQEYLLRLLTKMSPGELGSINQIETFARVTVCAAYVMIGLILLAMWISSRWTSFDKVVVSSATIAIWPLTRDYYLLQAPDYWIYEVPIYLLSTLWALNLLRRYREGSFQCPGIIFFVVSGIWAGIAFLQKPSSAGFALLPCLFALVLSEGSELRKLVGALTVAGSGAFSHWAIFLSYFRFNLRLGQSAYRHYWNWLAHHAETGTSLASSIGELLRWSQFLILPIAIGIATLLVSTAIFFGRRNDGPQGRRYLMLIGYIWLLAIAHALVVLKRPSGTSVVDAMFVSAFSVVLFLVLAPMSIRRVLNWSLGIAVLVACVAYKPAPLGNWPSSGELNVLGSIDRVSAAVHRIHRPLILLLPDNRIHPYTVEAFGLYTGGLALKAHMLDERLVPRKMPSDWLRQRLFPNSFIINRGQDLQLPAAFNAGFILMWGEASSGPRIQDYFPGFDMLTRKPGVVRNDFPIIAGGAVTAHLAYLKNVDTPILR